MIFSSVRPHPDDHRGLPPCPAFDLLPYEVMRHFIPWVTLLFWLLLVYGLRFKPEEDFQTARPKTRTT